MTFTELVRKSHFYFKQVKLPPDETMDIWIDEVGNYPKDFYSWCFDTLKSREKKLPDNLPVAIQELWQEWLRRNPSKMESREFKCRQPACKDGFLYVVKQSYAYVFRCLECDSRADYPAIPGSTLHTLELDGYRHDTVEETMARKPFFEPGKWKKTVLPRVQEIIEELPF